MELARKTGAIAEETATDGVYIVRTNLTAEVLDDAGAVLQLQVACPRWNAPSVASRRSTFQVRPGAITGWPIRSRAHVFLCVLDCYLEWHMRQKLAPLLFDDTDEDAAEAARQSVVAKAQQSPGRDQQAKRRASPPTGRRCRNFRTLLADLATLLLPRHRSPPPVAL